MSALILTMIGKHHLKLDMPSEFFEQSVTKMLDHYNASEGRSIAAVLKDRLDYDKNPEKTKGGHAAGGL